MAAKLFFKHLFTSIRRRPAQPLLLVLIVAISVIVSILALQLDTMLIGEEDALFYACNGNSNIIVTVKSGDEDNRFIDPALAEKLLGENADVCGTYSLPFYNSDNKLVMGVLADLDKVGDVFEELKFDDVPTTPAALKRCIYITEEYATEHNLSVDDRLTMSLFGKELKCKVAHILDKDIMGSYSVMVDTSTVVSVIAGSMYDGILTPYGTIYINYHAANEEDWNAAMEALTAVYSHGDVQKNISDTETLSYDMETILNLFVILVVLLSVATIYCCFSILTAQRTEENALFYAVGSKPIALGLVSMAEMAIYWFVGSCVGIGLSVPVLKAVGVVAKFVYSTPALEVSSALTAAACMFAATEFSMILFLAIDRIKKIYARKAKTVSEIQTAKKERRNAQIKNIVGIGLAGLAVIFIITVFCVNYFSRDILSIIAMILCLISMFFDGGILFKELSKKLSNIKCLPVPVRYGIKNSGRVDSQSNVASLFTVVIMILALMILLMSFCNGMVDTYKGLIDADYVAMNATSGVQEKVENLDCVESVYNALSLSADACVYEKEFTFDTRPAEYTDKHITTNEEYAAKYQMRKQQSFMILAATDCEVFTDKYGLTDLPKGNCVYIGETFSKVYEVEIHDKVAINIGGEWYKDLEVTGTFTANDTIMIIDAEALGINYNYMAIKGAEDYDKEEVYNTVFETCKMDNIIITSPTEMMSAEIRNMEIYTACIMILVVAMFIFAAIGIGDSVVSGYRSRREEFDCYAGAGMNKKALRIMKVSETLYSLIVGIGIVILMSGLMLLLIFECMLSFDANIFYVL